MYNQQKNQKNNMSESTTNQTEVSQIDIDLDDIFGGTPGADSIMLPGADETEKKKSIFSKSTVDMSFIDSDESSDTDDDEDSESKTDVKTVVDEITAMPEDEEEEEEASSVGRPKIEKSGLVEVFSKLIEDEVLIPFDDEKDMSEYTLKDWQELLQANFEEKEKAVREQTPKQFFEALPEELQYAAEYVANGGTDLKGLFSALAASEEVRSLDPTDEMDQEDIIRTYLRATNFGDDNEITEEIETWKDLGKLEQQANKFKPKLDKMQQQILERKLQEQEQMKMQQQQAAEAYMDSVYRALEPAEINGVKLDKKTQSMLYAGLVQPNYPSISGKNTNLLGHLLEKYQFVEPRHDLIAEALWLLSDPNGYRSKIMDQGKNKTVEKTVRQLKTEQSNRIASTVAEERESKPARKITRQKNIFKR
jgi:hypothetical protein